MQMMGQKGQSHRGQRTLKLLSSARGEGVYEGQERTAPVFYQMDRFEERNRQSVSGSLEGDVSFAEDKAVGKLKLATGEEIAIILIKPDEEGADFQSA
jgi:hypothetical protein